MADVIFKKERLMKKDIYPRLKSLLLAAGWKNISSKPSSDFDVFYSVGESGDKALCFQMSDNAGQASFISTSSNFIYFRLCYSYKAGKDSTEAGVFERSVAVEPWRAFYATSVACNPDVEFDLFYHVNKNRLIFAIEPTLASFSSGMFGNICFVGMPDTTFVNHKDGDGVIVAGSNFYATIGERQCYVTGVPYCRKPTSFAASTFLITAPQEFTTKDYRVLSQVAYGDTNEGIIGIMDGIYAVVHTTVDGNSRYQRTVSGDIITNADNTEKYYLKRIQSGYSAFGGVNYVGFVALRIE